MKIICIEPSAGADPCSLYIKPETALTRSDWPFFVPDWCQEVAYATQLVVRINKLGKSIPERFAHRYYDEVTVGVSFTARDVLEQLRQKGAPWAIATGFDGSAYCGQQWLRLSEMGQGASIQNLTIEAAFNDQTAAPCWTGHMRPTVDQIIALASRYYLLKTGDLVFTGLTADAGLVNEGDVIRARLQGQEVLTCRCK